MESPGSHDVAPAVTSLSSRRDDNNNMTYARRCVVMEIIKAETDYVTHLFDVVQVKTKNTPVVIIHCVSKKPFPLRIIHTLHLFAIHIASPIHDIC